MTLSESERIVLRAEREHAHCLRRWEAMRQEGRSQDIIEHNLEAHYPPPRVHDWRKDAR